GRRRDRRHACDRAGRSASSARQRLRRGRRRGRRRLAADDALCVRGHVPVTRVRRRRARQLGIAVVDSCRAGRDGGPVFAGAGGGNTPRPDAGWPLFSRIPFGGGAMGGTWRFLQSRVDVSTRDVSTTRAVEQVTIGYSAIPPNHPPIASDDAYNATQDTPLA